MQKLFSGFQHATAQQWTEQLIKDLKGIDYSTLIWKSNAGIDIKPFYTNEDQYQPNSNVKTKPDWAICENIVVADEKLGNAEALNALQNGATGLVFIINENVQFDILLNNILLEHIYCLFKITKEQLKSLTAYLSNLNPIHNSFIECDDVFTKQPKLNSNLNCVAIDASLYQEAGANTTNELAFILAHLNEYFQKAAELNGAEAIEKIHVSFSVGGDFFIEIAKIRSIRRLIMLLAKQYSVKPHLHLHAQTTLLNKSSKDAYNNFLRSATEAMSAAMGGADSIVVLPFDHLFNKKNEFSSRMARNQQLILKEESYLNRVADVSAGSYYIESITEMLCYQAWDQFKIIEKNGGLIGGLKTNFIQEIIATNAEILVEQFKEGELILVGINKFQNKNEMPVNTSIDKENLIFHCGIQALRLDKMI